VEVVCIHLKIMKVEVEKIFMSILINHKIFGPKNLSRFSKLFERVNFKIK